MDTDIQREMDALLDALPDGVVLIEAAGTLVYANAQLCRMLGYTREQLLGQPVELLVPERHRLAHRNHRARYATRPTRRDMGSGGTLVARHRSGVELPVDIALAPFTSPEGTSLTLVSIRDARDRVAAASALHDSEQRLFQAQKMEAIGRLAGGIAHDFNNIVGAIVGTSALLLERMQESDPSRQDISDILGAGHRAAALTRQLLAFSRKQMVMPEALDLNQVAQDVERMLRRIIGEDIELTLRPGRALHIVQIDRSQLEQVIVNLAINARDAMPRGGRLTIETANVELDAAYARFHAEVMPGPYVMLAVTDNGSGMDEETQQRIFEPFFTTKADKGTGLGLSTVYGIVKQAGGHVWVYSELGHGSTFKLYFPRSLATAQPSREPEARARGGNETILLVEDDALMRKSTAAILQGRGYRVLQASSGSEALALSDAMRESFDLLVSDVVMPGMSGRELATALLARRPALRVLYMSGYTDDAVLANGILERGVAFVQKPFSPDLLAAKVRTALDADPQHAS